jgi:hypothetical protein
MPVIALIAESAAPSIEPCRVLSDDPEGWSGDARAAFRSVLSELDAWCRKHDASSRLNSWVAEEAIRRSL